MNVEAGRRAERLQGAVERRHERSEAGEVGGELFVLGFLVGGREELLLAFGNVANPVEKVSEVVAVLEKKMRHSAQRKKSDIQ